MEGPAGEKITATAPERRAALIAEMQRENQRGHHCGACSGVCCTFLANTMQITPLEALDLKDWLNGQGRWNQELRKSLLDCVHRFRLDQDLGDGRRSFRRSYTCPFYSPGPQGCSISRSYKPYGCLAFNPRSPGRTKGGDCASNGKLLEDQSSPEEELLNQQLKKAQGLLFDKAPIPVALLALFSDDSAAGGLLTSESEKLNF